MASKKIPNHERMAQARQAARIAAEHPGWSKDRVGREIGLPGPRGAREKAVLRLLQLVDLPRPVQKMFLEEALTFAATEELGAHGGLTEDEKVKVAQKVAAQVLPAGGKQLRAVLEWLGSARHQSYGQQFVAEVGMTYEQALRLEEALEARRQEAIDREAEASVVARAIEAERLGPQVVKELGDIVERLQVVSEYARYVAHDRLHRPKATSHLLGAETLIKGMLQDLGHLDPPTAVVDTA